MRKIIAVVVALAVLGLLGWQVYERLSNARKPAGPRRGSAAVAVNVAPVTRGAIRDVSLFTGSLKPKSYFVCAPKIAGPLKRLLVNIGDVVKPGQLIAVIDDAEYAQQEVQQQAEVEVAKATVEESRSVLEIARRDLARAESLRAKGVASEAELDEAKARIAAQQARYRVAQAQLAQREAALKAAQVRLSYATIRASWRDEEGGGQRIVGERFVDEGAMLPANAPIVSIIDLDPVIALIHVIERDYSKIAVGHQAALTTDAFPDKRFTGKIARVAPLLKETSRQSRVEIEIPNSDGLLKPGMFVRAHIEFARHDNATLVPQAALAKRNGRQGVFLVDQEAKTAKFVPLRIGIVDPERVEVLGPALSGEVVTLGHHLLEDGGAIVLPGDKPKRAEGAERAGARP